MKLGRGLGPDAIYCHTSASYVLLQSAARQSSCSSLMQSCGFASQGARTAGPKSLQRSGHRVPSVEKQAGPLARCGVRLCSKHGLAVYRCEQPRLRFEAFQRPSVICKRVCLHHDVYAYADVHAARFIVLGQLSSRTVAFELQPSETLPKCPRTTSSGAGLT